jgi:hypothetical protein
MSQSQRRDPNLTESIIDLYTRIPDYSEVQHLGNSEFINKIERLKEEFRQIRASLYEDSDIEGVTEATNRVLNISKPDDWCRDKNVDRQSVRITKSYQGNFISHYSRNNEFLSVRSCELHRSPYNNGGVDTSRNDIANDRRDYSKSSSSSIPAQQKGTGRVGQFYDSKDDSAFQDEYENEESDERDSGSNLGSPLSRCSSNPEIYSAKRKEYIRPTNIEKR